MDKIEVKIKSQDKTYPIYATNEDITLLKSQIEEEVNGKNYIIIISQKVYKLYSKELNLDKSKLYILKDGEKEKNYVNYIKIMNFILSEKLTRQDKIIAIGGGVVGDISGFVASTYLRGIDYIQVPTTLLAMTDSSVGGKVAINSKYGKNLIGAFYQPKAVFINTNFLKTLEDKQFKSGLGEIIKYAFIENSCIENSNNNLINYLINEKDKIMQRNIITMNDLVKNCINLKISIVEKDEKENNIRRILNLGHTLAHALETITGYKRYTHGQAVIEGIKFVLHIAKTENLIDNEYLFLSRDLINKYNYPDITKYDISKLSEIILKDKKSTNEYIRLIIPNGYAKVTEKNTTKEEIKKYITSYYNNI